MLKLGTRGSALARCQTNWLASQLYSRGVAAEIVVIQTSGDAVTHQPIANLGAQGVFTKEIQRALLEKKIDVAVHSLKDLPTDDFDGLKIAAVPKRETVRDAFISHKAETIEALPPNSRIGTGSLRRKTQLQFLYGDRFRIEDIRGNVETRLMKLKNSEYDAVILAEAGLRRLGLQQHIRSFLEPPEFLPAAGQGALAFETRADDDSTSARLKPLSDQNTFVAVLAERAMLRRLQSGCSAPVGALGTVAEETLTLHGRVLSLDGKNCWNNVQSAPLTANPETLGIAVADKLLEDGAVI
ncbi:porphobilinogen deaminase [Planctomycetales bacterium]|nr:porphobilinogen deaminase [Planctomycetales bacterium]